MSKFREWMAATFACGGSSFTVFPAAVAFALFAVIVQSLNFGGTDTGALRDSLVISFITGVVSNLLLVLIARRRHMGGIWMLALTGAGILLPCLVFLLLYSVGAQVGDLTYMRVAVLNIIMAIAAVLVITVKNERFGLSSFLLYLLRRLTGGLLLGGVFYAVSAGMAAIVRILMMQDGSNEVFRQLACYAFFIVFIFSAGALGDVFLPDRDNEGEQDFRTVVEKVTMLILIPVIGVLTAAFIVWLCKGVWWNNWPSALDIFTRLAPLLAAGGFVFILSCQSDRAPCRIFRVALPCTGIPLLAVGVWRLLRLTSGYGVTDKRYFALLIYVLLAICFFTMALAPRGHGTVVLTAVIILSITAVMPALNYHTVSAFSQVKRAESIMAKYDMLSGTTLTAPDSIDESDRIELSRAVQYIAEADETAMAPWLPLSFDFYADYQTVFGVQGEFDEQGQSILAPRVLTGYLADKTYSVKGFNLLITNYTTYNLLNFAADGIVGENGVYSVRFTVAAADSVIAVITLDGQIIAETDITGRLADIAAYLHANTRAQGEPVPVPLNLMTIGISADRAYVRVVLKSVTATQDGTAGTLTTALTDTILIREK